jgi:hypothetical protein
VRLDDKIQVNTSNQNPDWGLIKQNSSSLSENIAYTGRLLELPPLKIF